MEKSITVSFAYVIEGSVAAGNVDTYFYSHLPKVDGEVLDKQTGLSVTNIPSGEQPVSVRGNSTLSCTALATIIRDYLNSRQRRTIIAIEGVDERVEYEGPGLEINTKDIESKICSLVNDDSAVRIEAHFVPS